MIFKMDSCQKPQNFAINKTLFFNMITSQEIVHLVMKKPLSKK